MSNKKKTENILTNQDSSPINLKGSDFKKENKKKYFPILRKKSFSSEIKDIYQDSTTENNSISLEVKERKNYRLVSNMLKMFLAGFVILFIFNSVNIYKKSQGTLALVEGQAYQGYEKLLAGSQSTSKIQFQESKQEFENAYNYFLDASSSLWFIMQDNTPFAKKSALTSSAKAILNSGKYFAEAGGYFTEAFEKLNQIPIYFISKNSPEAQQPKVNITEILKAGVEKSNLALIDIQAARAELDKIDQQILPVSIKSKFIFAKDKLDEIIDLLESMNDNFPSILKLLGDESPHKYLVLLQNNSEIRPAGGFIGSYILFDINKGVLENLKVEDVYHLDDKFNEAIQPPEFLRSTISALKFRDSNYSPDFYFAGQKAASMFEKEGGPAVDTVIAVDQSLLKDFLNITGPLQVGSLPNKISADNYETILTYIIESKIWGKEDPKHVLKMLVPEFKKEIFQTKNITSIMTEIYKAIQKKYILAYSRDAGIESLFDNLGLAGKVTNTESTEDYLQVSNYSIGGNKTEPFIEEKITHKSLIEKDGSITDEVTISRTHNFNKAVQSKWNGIWDSFGFDSRTIPGYIVDILGRGENKMLTRVLVPENSTLMEVVGAKESDVTVNFETEIRKTAFQFHLNVLPGNTSFITLKYKLPYKLDFSPIDTYKISIQKQPGSIGSLLTKTIELSKDIGDLKTYSYYPADARINDENKIIFATNLVYDRYISAAFGQ